MENFIGIKNYLVLLILCKYNRDRTFEVFKNHEEILLKEHFKDCIFYFNEKTMKLYETYNDNVEDKVINFLNEISQDERILFYKNSDFPKNILKIDKHPMLLFAKGNINLLSKLSLSVVGTRVPSETAKQNTVRIIKYLINENISIISGLALGIDSIAHSVSKDYNYKDVIGVIGTPLNKSYPKENKELQEYISTHGCLVSEMAYFENVQKWSFTRRNFVMAALSMGSKVIEASDTSGTISQARHAIRSNKYLLIPATVFDDSNNSWPSKFSKEHDKVFKFSNFNELKEVVNRIKHEYVY